MPDEKSVLSRRLTYPNPKFISSSDSDTWRLSCSSVHTISMLLRPATGISMVSRRYMMRRVSFSPMSVRPKRPLPSARVCLSLPLTSIVALTPEPLVVRMRPLNGVCAWIVIADSRAIVTIIICFMLLNYYVLRL